MTKKEAHDLITDGWKYKNLWRVFGDWLVFEPDEFNSIPFVYMVNYYAVNGYAYLTKSGELIYPNDGNRIPPKRMIEAIEKKLKKIIGGNENA